MTPRKTRPQRALVVKDYAKLEKFAAKFRDGHFNLLIIIGRGGIAKSFTVKKAIGSRALYVQGAASAFGMYQALYRHRGRPVVIDDLDELYTDKASVRLLKCLAQTDLVKTVAWYTAAAGDKNPNLPKEFETTSKTVIIGNDWKTLNQNVSAVENRGHLILFEPSAEEVHYKTAEWFWDQEIFDWFGRHLHLLPQLTMRDYIQAYELKAADMDWMDVLQSQGFNERFIAVAKLKEDPKYRLESERVAAFKAKGCGGKTTYFKYAKMFTKRRRKQVPAIKLEEKTPPVVPTKLRVVAAAN